ncbi:MAG: TonB-dependent receptor [Cyclobacteriaceae bacterium]|nr:TonB-dependent receptor [Cyclobacteriaceae bacterium]
MKKTLTRIISMTICGLMYGIALQVFFLGVLLSKPLEAQTIQSVKDVEISMNLSNATLTDCFREIEKQTNYKFSFDHTIIDKQVRFNFKTKNKSVSEVLLEISREAGLKFKQVNNNINVQRLEYNGNSGKAIEILIQGITITGRVTSSEDSEGLPGVNVVVKGTTQGTVTDVDGNYTLEVPSTDAVLVFSSVGYLKEEVIVGNSSIIDFVLMLDITALEEIVVVGYGTQQKKDVTGAVSSVSTEKTRDLPNYSALQSIQGQVAGVSIVTPERPGQDPRFLIRGNNSLTASNTPLVVVDGIIYNGNVSDFNPNDLAKIDVLKDASAAAVYGSRAANGVVLITTKTGTTDRPKFNFNSYVGFQEPEKLVPVMDGKRYEQKISDFNDILFASNPNASPIVLTNVEMENRDAGRETDWIDKSLRKGIINQYHLDVSGRSENTNYYVAGTYYKEEGIVKNDNFERITLNMNLTTHITDWYSVSFKSAYTHKDYSGMEASFDQAYRQSPYGSFYDEDGPGGYAFLPIGDQLGEHPLMRTLIDDYDHNNSLWGLVSSNLEIPFIPGLKWTMNFSSNGRNDKEKRFYDNETTVDGQLRNGIARRVHRDFFDWTFDNILSYKKIFNHIHSLDLTLLYSREYRSIDYTFAEASTFVSQALGYNNLELGEIRASNSNFEEQNSLSQMARLNYSFDSRYSMTLSVRRDGFSAFAPGNKFAVFPAAAFAWTITNENFLNDVNWLDYLKLRLSYGENGNQAIDRYSSLAKIGINQYLFGNGGTSISTFTINSLANKSLTWETTVAQNVGLDFSIFNERLNSSVDIYYSRTTDLLQDRSIPQITGFATVLTNIGEVENKGLEITLNSVNLRKGKLIWESGFAFSLNRNRIVSLGGVDANKDGIEDDDISNGWFIGQPYDAIYGFRTDGIWQLNNDVPVPFRAGDFRIVDVNGDGVISPTDDRSILGSESPNFRVGISNTLQYNQFSLYAMINWVQGGGKGNYYVGDNYETRSVNRRGFSSFSERFNLQDVPYWTPNNPSEEYPRLDYFPPFNHPILEDRSFLRIQDVSLAYNFDNTLLDKFKVQNMRIYASVKNLYTFTSWTGYNPETQTTIYDLPFLRSYTVGIDFSF